MTIDPCAAIGTLITERFPCFPAGSSEDRGSLAAQGSIVLSRLADWQGEKMPIGRSWVDTDVKGLKGEDYHIAKLILIVSLASYQSDPSLVEFLGGNHDEQRLIRILSFAAMSAARRLADHAGKHLKIPGVDVGLQPAAK